MNKVLIGVAAFFGFVLMVAGMNWLIEGPPDEMPSVCPVILRENGTWIEDGWDSSNGFPPESCVLVARTK